MCLPSSGDLSEGPGPLAYPERAGVFLGLSLSMSGSGRRSQYRFSQESRSLSLVTPVSHRLGRSRSVLSLIGFGRRGSLRLSSVLSPPCGSFWVGPVFLRVGRKGSTWAGAGVTKTILGGGTNTFRDGPLQSSRVVLVDL